MTHEATLREMAAIRQAVEHGRSGEPWVSQHAAYTRSILAGADALAALREARETPPCPLCGKDSSDGDWYRICGPCRWSAAPPTAAPPDIDLRAEIKRWAIYCFKRHGHDAHLYNGLAKLAGMEPVDYPDANPWMTGAHAFSPPSRARRRRRAWTTAR